MEATLLVPYNYSDPDHDFDFGRTVSMAEYNKAMVDTYRKYKPVVDRNIIYNPSNIGRNLAVNNEGEKERTNFRQQNTYMADTKVFVHDMKNQDMMIDELIKYYKTGEMFIIDLQMPVYDQNEELEPEVKAWIRETLKINSVECEDEERLAWFTKRDLKLKFKGSQSSALLKNTKMVDIVNNHTFAFLVEQVVLLKS